MKYRVLSVVLAVAMIISVVALSSFEVETSNARVHQHLTVRADDGSCTHSDGRLCSHLPLITIDTGGQTIPGAQTGEEDRFGEAVYTTADDGESTINVSVSVIDNKTSNNHLDDTPAFTTKSQFRIRGHLSRRFEKSPYLLKFIDDEGLEQDISVMGMGAHCEWALHGPYMDKSLIRNYLWYNISGEMMDYAPNVRFCELVLNGEYRGLYLMTEIISGGEDCRLHLKDEVKDTEIFGYVLRIDRPTEEGLSDVKDIYSYLERMSTIHEDIRITYPGYPNMTDERKREIELDYSSFEKALFSFDYDTEDYGYFNWIDTDNFVDYFIINEFTQNMDAGRYSTYIYKEIGEKYKLCVWDFNNADDNFPDDLITVENFNLIGRAWYFMLLKDEEFVEKILKRYDKLRKTYLNEEYLMNYIDETLEWLGPAVERNNSRWADSFENWKPLTPSYRNLSTHEAAVAQLKRHIIDRGEWLDENIHTLRQYCHPSRNKVYNH